MKSVSIDAAPFVGTVVMPDYLTLPQVLAFEDANAEIMELRETLGDKLTLAKVNAYNLPVILSIVSEWHISGLPEPLTAENFPASPRLASARFIAQVMGEITELYRGEIDIPNG